MKLIEVKHPTCMHLHDSLSEATAVNHLADKGQNLIRIATKDQLFARFDSPTDQQHRALPVDASFAG